MGIILGLAALIMVCALIGGILSGHSDMTYEDYRRAEYRNEYMWEKKQSIEKKAFDEMIQYRHP